MANLRTTFGPTGEAYGVIGYATSDSTVSGTVTIDTSGWLPTSTGDSVFAGDAVGIGGNGEVFKWEPVEGYTYDFDWGGYKKTKLPEGVEKMTLFDVYLVYAEDARGPIVRRVEGILARNEEDAKIKAGFTINGEWDTDFLTIFAVELGNVKVKAKPQEVKQV